MARNHGFVALFALMLVASSGVATAAGWMENGIPLCTATGNQYLPLSVSDSSGNVIVAWIDYRGGSGYIYAQMIDAAGTVVWDLNGKPLGYSRYPEGLSTPGYRLSIICNERDETIVAWDGEVGGVPGVYAQKLDALGARRWGPDGAFVGSGTAASSNRSIVSDGAGGIIVAWADGPADNSDIVAQRIDENGSPAWNPAGVRVCDAALDQLYPYLTTDTRGGAVIAWMDLRNGSGSFDIYAQRISWSGAELWADNGVSICAAENDQSIYYGRTVVSDGMGGAIIGWRDRRLGGGGDIYAQRIDATGSVRWQEDGAPVGAEIFTQANPELAADGRGGAYVVWHDYRNENYDVFAQHVDSSGALLWGYSGTPIYDGPGWQTVPRVVATPPGGILVSYQDNRTGEYDIYVQRLDANGDPLWIEGGVVLCAASGDQDLTWLVLRSSGDAVVAWQDRRALDIDIYAGGISPDGTPMFRSTAAFITSVLDVPNDEGGWVRMTIEASDLDRVEEVLRAITGYNVWRRIEPWMSGAVVTGADFSSVNTREALLALMTSSDRSAGIRLSKAMAAAVGFPPGEWESLGFHPALQQPTYKYSIGTLRDSTEAQTGLETYLVTAHTATASLYFVSNTESGYSVDNLAPGMTEGFTGRETASPPGLALTWEPNAASDLWRYDVHRGSSESFVPDASNYLGSTTATAIHDGTWVYENWYYYKLIAVDRHGNRSPAALLRPDDAEIGTLLTNFMASLEQSWIEVSWTISEARETAQFTVLRAEADGVFEELAAPPIERNGLSFSMTDRTCDPGEAYRYRVEIEDASGSRALFETESISIPVLTLALYQNHPNPFNPSTRIDYYLPVDVPVTLDIYDSSGKLVSRLLNGTKQGRGMHSVEWHGLDSQGGPVSSGVYFYRLQSGKSTLSRKMILLR